MVRAIALTALLASFTAFTQTANTPSAEHRKCQQKCAEPMSQCMMPCLNGEATKADNRAKMLACTKKCAEAQEPCMKSCDTKK